MAKSKKKKKAANGATKQKAAKGAKVSVKLIAAPANTKKKVYDVCVYWDKGNMLACGVVLADNETEAKKLAKGIAKKTYGISV